jgi:hypothetical protein
LAEVGNAENAKFNFMEFTQFMFQVWEDILDSKIKVVVDHLLLVLRCSSNRRAVRPKRVLWEWLLTDEKEQ